MADNAPTETLEPTPAKKRAWKLPELRPDSFGYFMLCREGAGGTLGGLLIVWQLVHWTPSTLLGVYISWFLGAAVLVWYNAAQRNALKIAGDEKRAGDDRQIARDTAWSSIPNYVLWLFAGSTLMGLILTRTPVFADPDTWIIRDRMIVTWPYFGYLVLVAFMLRGDQGQNSELAAKLKRLAQRFRRDEH